MSVTNVALGVKDRSIGFGKTTVFRGLGFHARCQRAERAVAGLMLPRALGLLFAIAATVGLSACESPTTPGGNTPVLSAAIVDLTKVVRFIPFGADLPGSGQKNPAYELVVTGTDTDVRAATAGTVTRIDPNEQGDFELHIAVPDSDFLVIYDHVLNVSVAVNEAVQPGTMLGKVGVWTATQGRVELQINRGNEAVCPKDLGTADFNAAHDAALAAADPAQQDLAWTSVCLASTVDP